MEHLRTKLLPPISKQPFVSSRIFIESFVSMLYLSYVQKSSMMLIYLAEMLFTYQPEWLIISITI